MRGKQWCKKIVLAVRYLRTNGRNLRKLLDKVAKDATLVDKIYAGCLDKWGNVPPAAGGSEDYSDEILDLSTPEWLDTAQGEAEPVTPSGTPSSTRMPTEETETEHSWHAEDERETQMNETESEHSWNPPDVTGQTDYPANSNLGAQAPVTPEWPGDARPPLPRRRQHERKGGDREWTTTSCKWTDGRDIEMASQPPV